MRVGIVHDWLTVPGGSERVLEVMLEQYPEATLRTLVYEPEHFTGSGIARRRIQTSFIDRLPGSAGRHRLFLPLMPMAIEQFDLSREDVIISNMSAVAHGVITRPDQLHVAYVNRTMTYAWGTYHQDLASFGVGKGMRGLIARVTYHYVRQWDYLAFQRPDVIVCNSQYSRRRVAKQYRREATVIHPPVAMPLDVPRTAEDHYVFVGRLVPVKRVDLLIRAFNRLGRRLIVVGDGPQRQQLEQIAGENVRFVGWLSPAEVAVHVAAARAFVFASEEDFGIAPVEAQMLGVPVVAFAGGGAGETVVPGTTGVLYPRQRVEDVVTAVEAFEATERQFDSQVIRERASAFSSERFRREMLELLEREWSALRSSSAITHDGRA